MRAFHVPTSREHCTCDVAVDQHYPSHKPTGRDSCRCGAPWENHKKPVTDYLVGIDGEGLGRDDHRYVLMYYSSEDGKHWGFIEADPGKALTTVECLDFILSIPARARPFAFSFGYDLTKILTDCDDRTLWLLARPEVRQGKKRPRPVRWKGYTLNLIGTKFTVQKGRRRVYIWDTFRFYQRRFTKALEQWETIPQADIDRIEAMKVQRNELDKLPPEQVRAYCLSECQAMAKLSRQLIEAHNNAGLPLKAFFGAGSTGSVLLKKLKIDKQHREVPDDISDIVLQAFFGGRFENSRIGVIPGPVFSHDVNSAYPYEMVMLPCLGCGKWRHTKIRRDLVNASAAIVHYRVNPSDASSTSWGPLPYRTSKGAIVFPRSGPGGWVWHKEFLAAESYFPGVEFRDAWVYHTDCNHQPFEKIPDYYLERLRLGKDKAGIPIKNGLNSGYGKTAQTIGKPMFQCMSWAGMITSGLRATMLHVAGAHKDMSKLMMIATDGCYTLEPNVTLPMPQNTGTDLEIRGERKPLGAWSSDDYPGIFAARPGVYFPLEATDDDIETFRARGIGRKALYDNHQKIVDAWRAGESVVRLGGMSRFHGLKSSIHAKVGKSGHVEFTRSELYGQWSDHEIKMTFNPLPKRAAIAGDNTLILRDIAMDAPESKIYTKGKDLEAAAAKWADLIRDEQPDGQFSVYK